jgi:hypothetical protein
MESVGRTGELEKVGMFDLFCCGMLTPSRLAFHIFLRDAQVSMTSLVPPIISYASMGMALPASRNLWNARNADEWKSQYLTTYQRSQERAPCLGEILKDATKLSRYQGLIDIQFVSFCHPVPCTTCRLLIEYSHL